ncbi:hypothetical protein RCH07_003286 [Arthrobacter sp. CG_A4]|nr:hypothetical protein [Arthrobacter sp. CG_A4]
MELAAGEELVSRAEGAVVDEDADELLHYLFGVSRSSESPERTCSTAGRVNSFLICSTSER